MSPQNLDILYYYLWKSEDQKTTLEFVRDIGTGSDLCFYINDDKEAKSLTVFILSKEGNNNNLLCFMNDNYSVRFVKQDQILVTLPEFNSILLNQFDKRPRL